MATVGNPGFSNPIPQTHDVHFKAISPLFGPSSLRSLSNSNLVSPAELALTLFVHCDYHFQSEGGYLPLIS